MDEAAALKRAIKLLEKRLAKAHANALQQQEDDKDARRDRKAFELNIRRLRDEYDREEERKRRKPNTDLKRYTKPMAPVSLPATAAQAERESEGRERRVNSSAKAWYSCVAPRDSDRCPRCKMTVNRSAVARQRHERTHHYKSYYKLHPGTENVVEKWLLCTLGDYRGGQRACTFCSGLGFPSYFVSRIQLIKHIREMHKGDFNTLKASYAPIVQQHMAVLEKSNVHFVLEIKGEMAKKSGIMRTKLDKTSLRKDRPSFFADHKDSDRTNDPTLDPLP